MVATNSVLTQYDASTVLKKIILGFAEGTSEKRKEGKCPPEEQMCEGKIHPEESRE